MTKSLHLRRLILPFILAFFGVFSIALPSFATSDMVINSWTFDRYTKILQFTYDTSGFQPQYPNGSWAIGGTDCITGSDSCANYYNTNNNSGATLNTGTHQVYVPFGNADFVNTIPNTGQFKIGYWDYINGWVWSQALPISSMTDATPQIIANPSTANESVGVPFNVNVEATSSAKAFNAAAATVTLSSNLSVTGISYATTNSCNLNFTIQPTKSSPSFAGAIFGGSSSHCTVYTLTITPISTGTGTITISNPSLKAYADNSELSPTSENGSYTIGAAATPTPTWGVPQLTVTSPLETYYIGSSYTLAGGKDTSITHVFVNGSETGVTLTSTAWSVPETLAALGTGNTPSNNYFTIYGSDGTSNTASQTVNVSRHSLGDINGDGNVDLTDASLFAVDYGKTDPSTFTYVLSNMNTDSAVDLTDYSILAKLEQ